MSPNWVSTKMKLYFTPRSHFARKVRILLELYAIDYEQVDIGNVADSDKKNFNDNPLMKVPVLLDGEQSIIDSDNIAQYIVKKYDKSDRYEVFTESIFDLNARAILNGIMSEEVKVILAERTYVPIEQYPFFDKALLNQLNMDSNGWKNTQNNLVWKILNTKTFT